MEERKEKKILNRLNESRRVFEPDEMLKALKEAYKIMEMGHADGEAGMDPKHSSVYYQEGHYLGSKRRKLSFKNFLLNFTKMSAAPK